MLTGVDTNENRMTELEKQVNMLVKALEEKDYEIESLKNHIKSRDAAEWSHTHTVKNANKGKTIVQESQPQNSTSIASLSVKQLEEMIANSIKTQYGGLAQTFSLYSKPYTKKIDNLRKRFEKKNVKAFFPKRRMTEGFDPKAYKLMTNAGYDFTTRTELKSVKYSLKVFTIGAYKIIDQEGLRIGPITDKFLKKFYA